MAVSLDFRNIVLLYPVLLTIHGTWGYTVPIRLSQYLHSVVDELGVPNLLIEIPLSDHVLELGFLIQLADNHHFMPANVSLLLNFGIIIII